MISSVRFGFLFTLCAVLFGPTAYAQNIEAEVQRLNDDVVQARSDNLHLSSPDAFRDASAYLKDAQKKMSQGGSIVTTSDGPLGPKFEFKAGTVLMARIGKAPMIPIACAADRAWTLNTWDAFIIPKPFARTVTAVGEPIEVPRGATQEQLEEIRLAMQNAIEALRHECEAALKP